MNFSDFSVGKQCRKLDTKDFPDYSGSHDHFLKHWREFNQKIAPGDIIYHYDTDLEQWKAMMGSEGYVLVRDGQIVDSFVLKVN